MDGNTTPNKTISDFSPLSSWFSLLASDLLLPLEDILDEASVLVLESPDTEGVEERVILSVEDAVDGSMADTDFEHKVGQRRHDIMLNPANLRVLHALITRIIKWRLMCFRSDVFMEDRCNAGTQCTARFGV